MKTLGRFRNSNVALESLQPEDRYMLIHMMTKNMSAPGKTFLLVRIGNQFDVYAALCHGPGKPQCESQGMHPMTRVICICFASYAILDPRVNAGNELDGLYGCTGHNSFAKIGVEFQRDQDTASASTPNNGQHKYDGPELDIIARD